MPNLISKWPSSESLAHAAAHLIVQLSQEAVASRGVFSLALSGGSTPKLLFELLAQPPYINNIPWKKTVIAFGDERFVPHSSPESNFNMATAALLSKVPIPKKQILAISTSGLTPAESAVRYEAAIKNFISPKQPFDLVLLGIGEEGHTASIFPGSPLLEEPKKWIQSIWVEEKQMDRVSFTLNFINRSRNVAFLVSGESKAAIVKTLFSAKGKNLPAARVQAKENTYWFLDDAAASLLK